MISKFALKIAMATFSENYLNEPYLKSHYLQLVCSDWIGPCNTTFSISYSKEASETYLQLDCGLIACIHSCQTPHFV